MSFHLKTLKDVGLLRDRRQSRWVYYSLDPAALETVREWMGILAASARVGRSAPRFAE